jgi:hypothetical protein
MMETNPITCPEAWREYLREVDGTVYWTDPDLKRITRLRLLSDRDFPFWDVSYCYGEMKDGRQVSVSLPFAQLPKRSYKTTIVQHAQREGVYAKGLGIFDALSTFS